MCFSLYTNGYKILSTKQPPGALTCLNGIRFISMLWVILGHTLVFSTSSISEYYLSALYFRTFELQTATITVLKN